MSLQLNTFLLILLLGAFQLFSQETKEDIEKKALNYFQKELFIEATPLYLRLLSLEPRNPNYNYRYGTCLLYNSSEKQDAFKYLNYSVQKSNEVENEAYYYLGKAYHLTYQFDKAIQNFEIYKQKAGSRTLSRLDVDRQIEMCRNGKSLIANISETVVLEKTKINKESFFRIYDLKDIGGELIVTEEFQNRQDKRNNHIPLIHFPANSNRIYYSSYGDNNDNKDIYVRTRLPDNSWSKEQPVFGEVNTDFNEDYPYMHPSGNYLYFSSEGHNSMGGYDVFRSAYDPETNSFGKPENMDISISSPDNDFLYIVDSLDKHAYFASQRESEGDKIHVYNVRVERFPIQMVILKGQFKSTINPSEKALSIIVNNNSGELMGEFKTSAQGDYLISLPKGGKYEFIVQIGKKEQQHRQFIDLPYLKEFRPLKQAITEAEKDANEIVIFQNLFDDRFENEAGIIAEAIKLKSKMEVNKNLFDIDSLDQAHEQRKVFDKIGLSAFTNLEIHDLIKSKYTDLQQRQSTTEELILKAQTTILNGNSKIEEALTKADSLLNLAKISDNSQRAERYTQLSQREVLKATQVKNEMDNSEVVLSFLEKDFKDKSNLLKESKDLNDKVKNIKSSDDESLISLLNEHKQFVSKELLKDTKIDAQFEFLEKIEEQLKKQEELKLKEKQLLTDRKILESKVEELKIEYAAASNRKKDGIALELSRIENQLSDLKNEQNYNEEQLQKSIAFNGHKEAMAQIQKQEVGTSPINFEAIRDENDSFSERIKKINNENLEFAKSNGIDLSETSLSDISSDNTSKSSNEVKEGVEQTSSSTHSVQKEGNQVKESSEESQTAEEVLAELDPKYLAEIKQLEAEVNKGTKTKEELIKRKYKAVISIGDAKTVAIEKNEKEKGTNSISQKIEVLNQLESQINEEIKVLEQEVEAENQSADEQTNDNTKVGNNTNEVRSTREDVLLETDPQYFKEIKKLEEKVSKGKVTKKALVERKYKAVISIGDARTVAIEDIENGRGTNSTHQKVEILNQLEAEINAEIKVLELAIEEEKNNLSNNSSTKEEERNKSTGKSAKSSNQTDSKNVAQTKDRLTSTDDVLLEADPQYFLEIKALEKDVSKGDQTKQVLIRRKYKAIILVENLTSEAIKEKESGIDSEDLDHKIELLSELELRLQSEINKLEDEITAGYSNKEEDKFTPEYEVLEDAHKGYQDKIGSLLAKFHSGKNNLEELLYAQEVHLSKINSALEKRKSKDEIDILNQEKEKVTLSIEELKLAQGQEKIFYNKAYNQSLRQVLLSQNEMELLNKEPKNLDEANIKAQALENIILQINRDLESKTNDLEIRYLNQVKNDLVNTRRSINFEFGDIVQTTEQKSKKKSTKIKKFDLHTIQNEFSVELSNEQKEEFIKLYDTKDDLLKAQEDDITLVDNRKYQLKIEEIDNKIAIKEGAIIEQSISSMNNYLNEKLSSVSEDEGNVPQSILLAQQNRLETEKLIAKSKTEKDPKIKRDILKSAKEKQNEAIQKLNKEDQNKKINQVVKDIISDNNFSNIDSESATKTQKDVHKDQNEVGIQILNIRDQINEVNAALPKAKRKEKAQLLEDKEELTLILNQLEDKHDKGKSEITLIKQQKSEDANKGIADDAIIHNLTYEEEVRIAQSQEYKNLLSVNNKLNQSQFELSVKESQLIEEQNELKQITNSVDSEDEFSEEQKSVIAQQLRQIDKTTGEIKNLRQEVRSTQQNIQAKLGEKEQEKEKIENMIAREVAPIVEAPSKTTKPTGLVMLNSNSKNYTDENPIPLSLDSPGGLEFRVQIGAFSKPVPNNTFTEFSPITGDVVRPGLIRYVAGSFNSKESATDARDRIRSMGYSDAFVVAYCDGERVPVYKAIELMNSGACVPTNQTAETPIITATESSKNNSDSQRKELDKFAYNKAPGAAEADVAESKMGLYFTIQIGVYNKPVSAKQLYDISPLITKRLPNGQIRYSSGIFNSLVEAKPKQRTIIDLGIKDAFVTAYYKGERISISQAHVLLSQNGESILELKNPTSENINEKESASKPPKIEEKKKRFLARQETQILMISKENYKAYPTQTLNRYNVNGNLFYYDTISKNIKSFVFTKNSSLIQNNEEFETIELYNFVYQVQNKEGVQRNEALLNTENNSIHLNVSISVQDLNSDLLETILNAPLNKHMVTNNSVLTVNFYALDTLENNHIVNQLQVLLAKLGATHISKHKNSL